MQLSSFLVLAACIATALASVLLDHAQYCTYSCRSYTVSGDLWSSALRTSVLRCAYDAPEPAAPEVVCVYSLTDGGLLTDDSSDRCAEAALRTCACQYGCSQYDKPAGQAIVATVRTAENPDSLTCVHPQGHRCVYSTIDGSQASSNSPFCAPQAANSCHASSGGYRGEDEQVALKARFLRRVFKRDNVRK